MAVKSKLPDVLIPDILAWSDDPSNPAETEYIVQEHAKVVLLHERWPRLNIVEHLTQALVMITQKLMSPDFPAFGNIYYIAAPIDEKLKVPLDSEGRFCINPDCSPLFYNRGVGEKELYQNECSKNRGPCMSHSPFAFW